ncbi:MAG: hypothetical protein KKF89_06315 [Nanoarchaeota archaeon]|nr:hypothetical protein [Nanoarchaeota archaeon]MBU1855312.1 hypothetical protein [Nanoarchaeota archaeon]
MAYTVKKGCPICKSDVSGDRDIKFYCKRCNILYDYNHLNDGRIVTEKPEKVQELKIVREPGYLYFVDKKGDVSRVRMARSRADKGAKKHELVVKVGLKKEKDFLYFVDTDGAVARTPMKRSNKLK